MPALVPGFVHGVTERLLRVGAQREDHEVRCTRHAAEMGLEDAGDGGIDGRLLPDLLGFDGGRVVDGDPVEHLLIAQGVLDRGRTAAERGQVLDAPVGGDATPLIEGLLHARRPLRVVGLEPVLQFGGGAEREILVAAVGGPDREIVEGVRRLPGLLDVHEPVRGADRDGQGTRHPIKEQKQGLHVGDDPLGVRLLLEVVADPGPTHLARGRTAAHGDDGVPTRAGVVDGRDLLEHGGIEGHLDGLGIGQGQFDRLAGLEHPGRIGLVEREELVHEFANELGEPGHALLADDVLERLAPLEREDVRVEHVRLGLIPDVDLIRLIHSPLEEDRTHRVGGVGVQVEIRLEIHVHVVGQIEVEDGVADGFERLLEMLTREEVFVLLDGGLRLLLVVHEHLKRLRGLLLKGVHVRSERGSRGADLVHAVHERPQLLGVLGEIGQDPLGLLQRHQPLRQGGPARPGRRAGQPEAEALGLVLQVLVLREDRVEDGLSAVEIESRHGPRPSVAPRGSVSQSLTMMMPTT